MLSAQVAPTAPAPTTVIFIVFIFRNDYTKIAAKIRHNHQISTFFLKSILFKDRPDLILVAF
jgi:hypothetical protein